jgi:hypothetical protein
MKIRPEQMDAMREAPTRAFESEMLTHLRGFAPELWRVVGREGFHRAIQLGLRRAEGYGFTNRGPVRLYLELMFALGSDFDTDPQLQWGTSLIRTSSIDDQMVRAEHLYDAATAYFKQVAGSNNENALGALRRISHTDRQEFHRLSAESLQDKILMGLRIIYPQKYRYVGELALRKLIGSGIEMAVKHQASSDLHHAFFVGMMYGFGHGVFGDPLYPWVGTTLSNSTVAIPAYRIDRLYEKTGIYLMRMLRNIGST